MLDQQKKTAESTLSNVRLKLLDPLGKGIERLQYEVRKGAQVLRKGITDREGRIAPFTSEIGLPITLYVKRFTCEEMKKVKTLVPWAEEFSVKLLSSKIKELMEFVQHEGSPGQYRRKTYVVQEVESLESVAQKNGTTAQTLAAINGFSESDSLVPGQVLKLPTDVGQEPQTQPSEPQSEPTPTTLSPEQQSEDGGTDTKAANSEDKNNREEPAKTAKADDRGENGTPKTTVSLECDQTSCIKVGDKGKLVEEINIRLTGFGGSILPPKPMDEFTDQTEKAVKQFQRDYMGSPETGKVCGQTLRALDDFLIRFPVDLKAMKCTCGKCDGFGSGFTDSSTAKYYKEKETPYYGTEYPGIHRSLFWAFRAALFYIQKKDADLEFSFLWISSGYRCWYRNAGYKYGKTGADKFVSTNHMGNALDIQFKKGKSDGVCSSEDVEEIREKIFVNRLGARLGWGDPKTNPKDIKVCLETAKQGAKTWVHMDVRNFTDIYRQDQHYAVKQSYCDGDYIVEIAKREGRLKLVNCGGIPMKPPADKSDRIAIELLEISSAGEKFIKGWEKFCLHPYDHDGKGACTIGWGRLIGHTTCQTLEKEGHEKYKKYKNGITSEQAETMFAEDLKASISIVKKYVQVPLYQHEFDALVSLIFNTGGFKTCPKLLAKLNTKDYCGCCDEFADITSGGVAGLVKRRKAEMKIFIHNMYDDSH